ncbi:MAG: AbrB/MazE/SpoVT family DNA-binding domain-containing protein [wastewater metagenome]|nr:AbrB/MazE/SpoVT family DNA-binding domain-containing protein [Candidatus Loosdrechtia aerotolerans]
MFLKNHNQRDDMAVVKVKKNFQLTLPNNLRKELNISEGDFLDLEVKNGEIVVKPIKLIPKDQQYFYTPEWQKKEKEADSDLARKKRKEFKSVDDLIKELHSK